MGPNQTYKLLYNKRNHNKMKRQTMDQEKISADDNDQQELNFQNIQTDHIIPITKKQTTQSKPGQKT